MLVHAGQLSLLDLSASARDETPVSVPSTRQEATRDDTATEAGAPPVGFGGEATVGSDSLSDPLLTTREAADILRVHPRTVQRLVRSGALPAVRLGRAIRFERRDLSALTDDLKHESPSNRAASPRRNKTQGARARKARSRQSRDQR
jgi:excisionase family DNA binding protein